MVYTDEELIEKFGITDNDGVLVVDRNALKRSIIDRGVILLKEIDVLKDDGKEIIAEAAEYGFDKAEIKELIKYAHKNSIDQEVEALREIQVKLGALMGEPSDAYED